MKDDEQDDVPVYIGLIGVGIGEEEVKEGKTG